MFKSLAAIAAALLASVAYAHSTSHSSSGASAPQSTKMTSSYGGSRIAASNAADAASASSASGTVPSSCIGLMGSERSHCMETFGATSGQR